MELLAVGPGAVPNTLVGFWEPIPHSGLPCPALIKGGAYSSCNLICHGLLISMGGLSLSEQKLRKGLGAGGRERTGGRRGNYSLDMK